MLIYEIFGLGDCKSLQKTTREGKIEQSYFSGLVYRCDYRSITELKEAGGFLPRKQREPNDSIHIKQICESILYDEWKLCVSSCYERETLVATSKNINYINDPLLQEKQDSPSRMMEMGRPIPNKYMIDAKLAKNYGLDADYTLEKLYPGQPFETSYEVCFENPLPFETIVGFFKNGDHTKFYQSDEYKGDFSWKNRLFLNLSG
ncbi:hypothetical protein NX722_04445 [Endozoicomonas gorgoniicola]|uniref:Uncharacterized protein n=1 Tax=Endozoicomonas gorgoniicola TaxID=1234144 RepID=A0ABT3MRA9_9GAMM|nr:hypothetical protein [Endozoicomonas gorgoniicola]MCW7551903.1 hypothetical protein [Endozoicomonas gorgoniicola]